MTQQNHQDYYVTRAATSRGLAERAADPAIAAIHVELASRYDLLATGLTLPVDRPKPPAQPI